MSCNLFIVCVQNSLTMLYGVSLLLLLSYGCRAYLVVKGEHILNESSGERLHMQCVNWYGAHQEPMIPGGLEVSSSDQIADLIVQTGANCVRIPLSDYVILQDPVIDPRFIMGRTATAMQVLDTVVMSLSSRHLMMILNSHTSIPGWVGFEGNGPEDQPQGLWYGYNISTLEWVRALTRISDRYRSNPWVVGIDLRNEIHDQDNTIITWGKSLDVDSDWLAASTLAERSIAAVNPNVLIIVSGLCRAYDLRPLMENPGPIAALHRSKLVYTTHVYTFSWWWSRVDWQVALYMAMALLILLMCTDGMCISTNTCCNGWALVGSFAPFSIIWIAVACTRASITRDIGCETLAVESNPWIVAGSLLLVVSVICLWIFALTNDEIACPLLYGLLCWVRLACVLVIAMSPITGSYWMVVDDLRRWRLDNRAIPIFVGEFGDVVGTNTLQWDYLLRVIRDFDLDFAYWALNGRKWRHGSWEPENYGLLNYNYSALSDKAFTSNIFRK